MIKSLLKSIICLISCFWVSISFADQIDKVVAFGDSLSDNGNFYVLTSKLHFFDENMFVAPKSPPYFQGRFSNGKVWTEKLASLLKVPLDDYAYGGAWAEPYEDSLSYIPPNLDEQVMDFVIRSEFDKHRADHLYVIWAGANDYLTVDRYLSGELNPDHTTTHAVSVIQANIQWLIGRGANKFLILNLPDLSVIPASKQAGQDVMDMERKLTNLYNSKLALMLDQVRQNNPTVKIILNDINLQFGDLLTNPDKYHLKNVTDACYGGGYTLMKSRAMTTAQNASFTKNPSFIAASKHGLNLKENLSLNTAFKAELDADTSVACQNQDEYLYWDHVHPTRAGHAIIARKALELLKNNQIDSARG